MSGYRSAWIRVGVSVFWILTLSPGGAASMIEEVQLQMQQGVEVLRTNGSRFQGQFSGLIDGGFVLQRQVGRDGVVEVDIQWHEVGGIEFPGESLFLEAVELLDGSQRDLGMEVLWEFYLQRSPYFSILPETQLEPFLRLAEHSERTDPTRALGILRSLGPSLLQSDLQVRIASVQLRCYLALELFPEAEQLARQQIAAVSDPGNASLSWIALSLCFLTKDEASEAWSCAVHPLLFDRNPDSRHLRDAYLLAALASLRLGRLDAASRYVVESATRGLTPMPQPYLGRWWGLWQATDWQDLPATVASDALWVPDPEHLAAAPDPRFHPVPVVPLPLKSGAPPPSGNSP